MTVSGIRGCRGGRTRARDLGCRCVSLQRTWGRRWRRFPAPARCGAWCGSCRSHRHGAWWMAPSMGSRRVPTGFTSTNLGTSHAPVTGTAVAGGDDTTQHGDGDRTPPGLGVQAPWSHPVSPPHPRSCGGHFNPDGECHGGPQDQHRVSRRPWLFRGAGGGLPDPPSPPCCAPLQHVGDLGNIWADAEGKASFRMEDSRLKVRLQGGHGGTGPLPRLWGGSDPSPTAVGGPGCTPRPWVGSDPGLMAAGRGSGLCPMAVGRVWPQHHSSGGS